MKDKYLIVGLGNPQKEWANTRHNIGWNVLLERKDLKWTNTGEGFMAEDGYSFFLRPTCGMNSSGEQVKYWMDILHIPVENILILVDDMDIPFGSVVGRGKGSTRHNGLRSIEEKILTSKYSRVKFGIGHDFESGKQLEFVLGDFTEEEKEKLPGLIGKANKYVDAFIEFQGRMDIVMNKLN